MENQITCPSCKRTITNNAVVESAAKGEDHARYQPNPLAGKPAGECVDW